MTQAPLLLIGDDDACPDALRAHAEAALVQIEPAARPPVQVIGASALVADARLLGRVAVVWAISEARDPTWMWEVLGAIGEAQVPALVSRPMPHARIERADDGIIGCPLDSDPAILGAILHTLLIQSPVMRAMRSEIKLIRAHQGGLADQIGRIDEELRLAAQLQQEFLPTEIPHIDGVGFRVLWRPAGYVSGDIYGVTRLDETHVGFFLADAVGHGVPAALMTVFIKQSLDFKHIDPANPRGYRIVGPGEALAQLNRDMVNQQNGKVRFATACCGVVDTAARKVTLARAGHPFPIVLRADGTSQTIEADGGLLGVFEEEVFEQQTVALSAGDRLLLYSDGFEMAFPDDGPDACVANTRYTHEFADLIHGSAAEAIQRLEHKLDQQAGSLNQRDDLTVLCLAVDGPAAAARIEHADAA